MKKPFLHSTSHILHSLVFLALMLALSSPIALAAEDDILPKSLVESKVPEGQALPTGDFRFKIIPKAINLTLALVGTVSVIVFVYAGIMLIIAQGNEEDLKKFKEMIMWSLIGLVFIVASYAIVTGVMTLVFK